MTILSAMYEKEAYDRGHKEGYDEGYAAGHLAAKIQTLREGTDLVRAGIIDAMKEEYERKIRKAYIQGKREGERVGYDTGYLDGKSDGFQEGAAAGRRERIEQIILPGEVPANAVARLQARESGYSELNNHLRPIIEQLKEGSPVSAAIATRIDEAILDFLNQKL